MGELILNPAFNNISDPIAYIEKAGEMIAKSGMMGITNPIQGKMVAMICLAEQKHWLEVKRTYHFFQNGDISMRSDYMLGAFHGMGGESEVLQRDPEGASVKLTYKGKSQTFSLTWQDAQQERFVWTTKGNSKVFKDNWSTPRGRMQMLWARVISDGVRTMAPQIVAGIYTPEEVQDFDDAPAAKKGKTQKPDGEVIDAEFQVETAKEASPATTGEEVATPRVQDAHEVAAVVETTASPVEQAPFETTEATAEKPVETVTENPSHRQAMELELAANLVVLEMTEAFCLEQLQKKLPNLKTLDELTDEQFAKVNDRFRKLAQEKN